MGFVILVRLPSSTAIVEGKGQSEQLEANRCRRAGASLGIVQCLVACPRRLPRASVVTGAFRGQRQCVNSVRAGVLL